MAGFLKSYKVAICDTEPSFTIALMNYINRNAGIPILAMAFTGVEQLQEYLRQHETDMIVVDEAMVLGAAAADRSCGKLSDEILASVPVLLLLRSGEHPEGSGEVIGRSANGMAGGLSDGLAGEVADKMVGKVKGISKYSPASVLVKKMLEVLGQKRTFIGSGQEGVAIGIYSPIGRSGKSRLAGALCEYWSGQPENPSVDDIAMSGRTLYLGMEEYGPEGTAMETVLYYLKQRSENLSMQLKALAQTKMGYDFIPSAGCYQELRELSAEDMEWLLQTICREGYYGHVAADIGSGSLAELKCLLAFDVIYMPYLQEREARQRLEMFIHCVKRMGIWEDLNRRCYPVNVEEVLGKTDGVRWLEQARADGSLSTLHSWSEQWKDE